MVVVYTEREVEVLANNISESKLALVKRASDMLKSLNKERKGLQEKLALQIASNAELEAKNKMYAETITDLLGDPNGDVPGLHLRINALEEDIKTKDIIIDQKQIEIDQLKSVISSNSIAGDKQNDGTDTSS